MKQNEFKPCILCNKGVMHSNDITFYRVKAERLIIDPGAVQRAYGMEMMMGAAAPLAQIMGPNEDLAKSIEPSTEVLICQSCGLMRGASAHELMERAAEKETEE